MRNPFLAAGFAALVVAGCSNEASLTAPSSAPTSGETSALGLAASRHLVNEGPLCVGARTPGFYCQNQGGKNPNLTAEEFDLLEEEATALLGGALGDLAVRDAVCIRGNRMPEDQLARHLAALALNLAANLIDESTLVTDGSFATVGDAFVEATATASDAGATKQDRNAVKDALDDINNNLNTELGEDCVADEGDGEGEGEE